MFSYFTFLFSVSSFPKIHFLVAIFVSFRNANVVFIPFSVHKSLLRLSSEFASVLSFAFCLSTVFLSFFCNLLALLSITSSRSSLQPPRAPLYNLLALLFITSSRSSLQPPHAPLYNLLALLSTTFSRSSLQPPRAPL